MSITYLNKDITTITHGVIAHGCNCSGSAYRSGVAGAIRHRWNKAYVSYRNIPPDKLQLGHVDVVEIKPTLWIMNCLTQKFYGSDGKRYANVEAIRTAMVAACAFAEDRELPLYLPKIGCGLGGLDWDTEVLPIIEQYDQDYQVKLFVCEI